MINFCIQTVLDQKPTISWETIVAILGALAWLPWVYDKLTPSKLYGSIISTFENQGRFNQKSGTLHFLKVSISCINKNFNVSSCLVDIKYKNNNQTYIGNIFWARSSTWSMNIEGTIKKSLIIPNDKFLGFVNMFEKDKSDFYYLTFIVEKDSLEQFEEIRITFKNPKGKEIILNFKYENLNPDKILFDETLWQ